MWSCAPGRVTQCQQVEGEVPDKVWPKKKTSTVDQAEDGVWLVGGDHNNGRSCSREILPTILFYFNFIFFTKNNLINY